MNFSLRFNMSLRETRRWLAAALAFVLVMMSVTGVAHAAEDTVTGIEFDYLPSEYNNSTSSLETFVEDDKVIVSVLASLSGSSSKKDVTSEAAWKSSNTSYVKVDKGVLTGVGKGTATISATYKGFTINVKASSDYIYDTVTLMNGGTTAPATMDIEIGQPLVFKLNGTKSNDTKDVTTDAVWTTSSSAIATVNDGTITLIGVGTVTITAKLKGKSDSIIINVSSPYKSISIDSNTSSKLLEMDLGSDDQELTATVAPKTGGTEVVTSIAKWVSANDKIASVDKGIVTAKTAGKTSITVSYKGVSTSIEVVVRTAYQSIKLSPEKEYHMLLQDEPLQIKADVLDNKNDSEDATLKADWTSSNIIVATVLNGKVYPKAVGTTKITANYKGVSRSIEVTVYPSISELSIETETIDGFAELSGDLPKVTATTFDGSKVDVSKLVTWTSKDEKIAEIKDGKWTAKALGESILTATAQGYTAEVNLIVHIKPLKLLSDTKDLSLVLGKERPYPTLYVVNEDGEEEDVTAKAIWKSSSDNIVLKESSMKGIEESNITITATYLNKTLTIRVKIEEEIIKLVAEPTVIELFPSKSKSVKVTGYYKSGKQVSLGSRMNWEIGNPNLASVSGTSVKGIAVGTTKISGSYQEKTLIIPVVISPKLKSLTLSSKSVQLSPGGTFTAKLQANYTTGNPVVVTEEALWTTFNASVATVKDGKITAVKKGSASIKATFAGKTVTIRVTVK